MVVIDDRWNFLLIKLKSIQSWKSFFNGNLGLKWMTILHAISYTLFLLPIVDYVMTISRKCAQFCFKLYYFFMFGKIKRYEAFQLLFEEQETDVPPTLAYIIFFFRRWLVNILLLLFFYICLMYIAKKKVTLYCDETEQQLCARGDGKSKKNLDTPTQNLIIITLFCYHLYGYNVSLLLPFFIHLIIKPYP